jgi:DNA invertase Pin-like site-specific DNA recombinase
MESSINLNEPRQKTTTTVTPKSVKQPTKTGIIYCRVSTEKQQYQGTSLDTQEDLCKRYCQNNGISVLRILRESKSSGNMDMQETLKTVIEENITHLIVYSVSRFSRNVSQGLDFARQLSVKGIALVSATELLDTSTPSGQYNLISLLNNAEFERKLISQRVRDVIQFNKSRGFVYGKAPYTKQAVRDANNVRKFSSNPVEENVLRFIKLCRTPGTSQDSLNLLLSTIYRGGQKIQISENLGNNASNDLVQPLSFENIAEILNQCGLTKRGKSWTSSSIRSIVKHS